MRPQEEYRKQIEEMRSSNPFMNQVDIAYEIILEDILSGNMSLGEKIKQEVLASGFEMSRTPVREALVRLEEEGFIIKNEKSGYQVYKLVLKDYVDFCEYRIQIETFGAYLAARTISQEQLLELRNILKEFAVACDEGKSTEVLQLDARFHELIMEASDNAYLIQSYRQLCKKKNLYCGFIMRTESFPFMKKQHMDIYQAIKEYDAEKAKEMMRSHLAFYIRNLYNVL